MAKDKVKAKKGAKYDSSHIETLSFPQNVRSNPGMYLGGTDVQGVWNITRELLDNALDEYLAGRNKAALLHCCKDGSMWVQDAGHGIPQGSKTVEVSLNGKMVKSKMPTMQAVFGQLHTSGKFRSDAYAVSTGTHGVGSKGTNATSEFFNVYTCYEGSWYSIKFKKGLMVQGVEKCKAPKSPLGKTPDRGTLIHFKPDSEIFPKIRFTPTMAVEWAEIMAYLNPGFQIALSVEGKKPKVYLSKNGPKDYITARLAKLNAKAETQLFEVHHDLADVVIAFSTVDGCDVRGFVNGLHNSQGGTHVEAVTKALFQAIAPFKGKKEFTKRDFDEGMLGVINAKLHKAQFNSQDKVKLADPRMTDVFFPVALKAAEEFFKGNKALAGRLVDKAGKISELRKKFTDSKQLAAGVNKLKREGPPANYAPADRNVKTENVELFIVEGDSAAGGFRKVRERHQALLPLSGKIKNVAKSKEASALVSKAIISILYAIGYEPKSKEPLKKCQVGKIICLADADADGGHINSLLLTLFYRIAPVLFERGMVYVANMPEYMAQDKGMLILGKSQEEVKKKLVKLGSKASPKHLKGWGEVDPNLLKILAISDQRKLLKIKPITKEDEVEFMAVMGSDVSARREALDISEDEQHG